MQMFGLNAFLDKSPNRSAVVAPKSSYKLLVCAVILLLADTFWIADRPCNLPVF